MFSGQTFTCVVEKCVYGGDGLARVDGEAVFLPGALPGETVEAQAIQCKKSFSRARVLRIAAPSPDRIAPCCLLPGGEPVPGCVYGHADYRAEVRMKQAQLDEMFGRLPGALDAPPWQPPLGPAAAARPLGYRNKITLHAGRQGRRTALGYVQKPSMRILDVPACPLADDAVNAALAAFRRSRAFGRLRPPADILFRATPRDGGGWWCPALRSGTLPPFLTEETPDGPLRVSREGFFQMNRAMARRLTECLCLWFEEDAGAFPELVDGYCGAGGLGLACAKRGGSRLAGFEADREAVECARINARARGIPADYRRAAPGRLPFSLAACVGEPRRTTLVLDPPRGGLDPGLAEQVRDSRIPRVFYVSCDPATLVRDIRILLAGGYAVRRRRLFDLFPRTARFETLVELRKKV